MALTLSREDQTRLLLNGIGREREHIANRSKFLDDLEKELKDGGMTGTGSAPPARSTASDRPAKGKGKRKVSQATRDRLSKAQKDRWAQRRKAAEQNSQDTAAPPAIE